MEICANICSKGNDLENEKKKKAEDLIPRCTVSLIRNYFGFGYIYTKSASRSYPPSFERLFFDIGKYLVTRVDRVFQSPLRN